MVNRGIPAHNEGILGRSRNLTKVGRIMCTLSTFHFDCLRHSHRHYIVLKHRRCVEMGRWREREIGPYAKHELCRLAGSHIDAETGRKLCKESCCFGARKKRKTAKAAPKAAIDARTTSSRGGGGSSAVTRSV